MFSMGVASPGLQEDVCNLAQKALQSVDLGQAVNDILPSRIKG